MRIPKRTTLPFGCPALLTDTRFLAQRVSDPFGGDELSRRQALAKARAAGVNTEGKVYISGLGDERFDPRNWVESRDDIRRQCERTGRSCQGQVNVKAREPEVSPNEEPYRVADDIIEAEAQSRVEESGVTLSPQEMARLKDEIREQVTPVGL